MFLSSVEISPSLTSWFSVLDPQETHTPSVHSGTTADVDLLLVLVTGSEDEPLKYPGDKFQRPRMLRCYYCLQYCSVLSATILEICAEGWS